MALRAGSAVRLLEGQSVTVNAVTKFGPATVVIRTAYERYGAGRVPRGIWFGVRGDSPSLDKARSAFVPLAESLATIACLATNAGIEPLIPTVALDVTRDSDRHDFWQFVQPTHQGLPDMSRLLDRPAFGAVLNGLEGHEHRDVIERALANYREAMRNMLPGRWLMAAAHSWIGFEALKSVALERELTRLACSRAQLAKQWQVKTSVLENEARLRLLFPRRAALHKRAKEISDEFEHALANIDPLHVRAENDAIALGSLLRRGILRQIFFQVPRALTRRSLTRPFPIAPLQQFFRAVLVGDTENLAPADLQYPHLDLTGEPVGVELNPDGTYNVG
jgi:hypothetical protein